MHRQMKWKISHLPSLQEISDDEYLFISKDERDPNSVVAAVYDMDTNKVIRSFFIGSNENMYPTDCVSAVNNYILYVALNKRSKASDPY